MSILLAAGLGPEQAMQVTAGIELCLQQLRAYSIAIPLSVFVLRRS
ncbi:hypothetical protein [Sphingomonas sp. PR090111-T3T-6A]|nr:hypothetical protein [Sphingomonas sp. PR090111-T3T-6A]